MMLLKETDLSYMYTYKNSQSFPLISKNFKN